MEPLGRYIQTRVQNIVLHPLSRSGVKKWCVSTSTPKQNHQQPFVKFYIAGSIQTKTQYRRLNRPLVDFIESIYFSPYSAARAAARPPSVRYSPPAVSFNVTPLDV
ncbi:hypothetical protein EVAR_79489_1 [Eumeta japonica]|uniref:Uncharacterized protein n=1 Tax=Eumeta variegata TaxID=151549 RepID=A0A4C1UEM8_EUMVA|nr:hypothetical protein EVAR_79489_1 [Eumeta japonica]